MWYFIEPRLIPHRSIPSGYTRRDVHNPLFCPFSLVLLVPLLPLVILCGISCWQQEGVNLASPLMKNINVGD